MRKFMTAAVLLSGIWLAAGCGKKEPVLTGGYEYLIGVSLSNVMEPWLNNLVQVMSDRAEQGDSVNLIFRDAAGSTEKQIQDIETLMKCGVDLLIVTPDTGSSLNNAIEKAAETIPVVAVGTKPETDAYTTVIQADDEGIGKLAGEYIVKNLYDPGEKIVVIQGVEGSPISANRLSGFKEAVSADIPEEDIFYYYGDWLRDSAELRMKDYLVENAGAGIVFAFNDEMAYGAYLACQQFRVGENTDFIGVDGFDGEKAGRNMVDRGILKATVQSPDFGALAYEKAVEILKGEKVDREITIIPEMITGEEK